MAPFAAIGLVSDGSPVWAYIVAGLIGGLLMGVAVGAIAGGAMSRLLRAALRD
ncbi:MAG: hypothetical protein ACOX9A_04605 [Anaerolineae bacterium]